MDNSNGRTAAAAALAGVQTYGVAYRRMVRRQTQAHRYLVAAIRVAHEAGAGVTELAAASGLSRQAVHRAVKPDPAP